MVTIDTINRSGRAVNFTVRGSSVFVYYQSDFKEKCKQCHGLMSKVKVVDWQELPK